MSFSGVFPATAFTSVATTLIAALLIAAPVASDDVPDFVEVPEGPFSMGAASTDTLAFDNERWPPGVDASVPVEGFYIARHEVTVAQFAAFARAASATIDPAAIAGPPTHPVTFVSWPDALAYSRWLTKTLANAPSAPPRVRDLVRAGWRVTLPTEAQWEKAARGTDGRIYPWGTKPLRTRANYQAAGTTPVGQFVCPECPYGLSDMSGNVWEWTASPYQPYPYDPSDDRVSLSDDALWVIRGGGYPDDARLMRTTTRTGAEPGARRPFIGFRVVLSQAARQGRSTSTSKPP